MERGKKFLNTSTVGQSREVLVSIGGRRRKIIVDLFDKEYSMLQTRKVAFLTIKATKYARNFQK